MQSESGAVKQEPVEPVQVSETSVCQSVDSNNTHNANVKSQANRKNRKNRRTLNKVDMKAKLERSRQSARECRARKKLRYQYLEDLVVKRERANVLLRKELEMYREICKKIDAGQTPQEMIRLLDDDKRKNNRRA